MRFATFAATAFAFVIAAGSAASAQTGMMNGSSAVGTQKAHCAPSDPAVMVNMSNKTYMAYPSSSMKSSSGTMAMASPSAGASSSQMKSVCMSTAKSMGYKMAPGGKMMASPAP